MSKNELLTIFDDFINQQFMYGQLVDFAEEKGYTIEEEEYNQILEDAHNEI